MDLTDDPGNLPEQRQLSYKNVTIFLVQPHG